MATGNDLVQRPLPIQQKVPSRLLSSLQNNGKSSQKQVGGYRPSENILERPVLLEA